MPKTIAHLQSMPSQYVETTFGRKILDFIEWHKSLPEDLHRLIPATTFLEADRFTETMKLAASLFEEGFSGEDADSKKIDELEDFIRRNRVIHDIADLVYHDVLRTSLVLKHNQSRTPGMDSTLIKSLRSAERRMAACLAGVWKPYPLMAINLSREGVPLPQRRLGVFMMHRENPHIHGSIYIGPNGVVADLEEVASHKPIDVQEHPSLKLLFDSLQPKKTGRTTEVETLILSSGEVKVVQFTDVSKINIPGANTPIQVRNYEVVDLRGIDKSEKFPIASLDANHAVAVHEVDDYYWDIHDVIRFASSATLQAVGLVLVCSRAPKKIGVAAHARVWLSKLWGDTTVAYRPIPCAIPLPKVARISVQGFQATVLREAAIHV